MNCKKKVLWVSESAWRAAAERARASGVPLTEAASSLLLIGERRAAALARHNAARRPRDEATA